MQDFEKLGAFYLGRRHDAERGKTTEEPLLYDAKDLTTHAVCVGMTGSGKTGLGMVLLEEAAIDGIPAIVIDPKGDMGNLMLTFPALSPEDFRPWIDPAEAARKGVDPATHATGVADTWREGIAAWGQDGERIRRLRAAAEVRLYTPGGSAGLPLTVLRSFDAPSEAVKNDPEALADRIQSAAAGLLGLVGIDADPVKSREAILLANVLQAAWSKGRGLSLADLVREVQTPPFERLGVLDLESFFPARERSQLALALNGLLASPGFAAWREGEPLDVGRLLHGPGGKPRVSILSIAHLSEAERVFFVALFLNEVLAWMRSQSGTGSLRALLYMDEIFGFFPPTREPASKRPMLTLLKQARAYGLGVVLATQNPVDLDYKGLSNTGTWFLGRLQTERDKARVLDGLEGVAASAGHGLDRRAIDALLSGLDKRVFLMKNVHEEETTLFHTRWALSYLRGPLSREHVRTLTAPLRAAQPAAAATAPAPATAPPVAARPPVPAGVAERFLARRGELGEGARLLYRPALGAGARLHYANAHARVDVWNTLDVLAPLADGSVDWEAAALEENVERDLRSEPEPEAGFAELPAAATNARSWMSWGKALKGHLYRERPLLLLKSKEFKLVSEPGESEEAFRGRVALAAREARDAAVDKLKKRYAPKVTRLQERVRKAEERVGKEEEQYSEKKSSSLISIGTSLLGAFLGRKLVSSTNVGRAGTAARSVGRARRERQDVERARRDLASLQDELETLEVEFREALGELQEEIRPGEMELDELLVRPRKTEIEVAPPRLVWTPWRVDGDGLAERAYS